LPKAVLIYNIESVEKKIEFSLPLYVNKYIIPVDMPKESFDTYFSEYSKSNPNYYKLDAIIPNPAPPEIELTLVMQKME